METKATMEPSGSPVPGVIPEPTHVHHDVPAHEGRLPAPRSGPARKRATSPGGRNPVGIVLAKLLSAIRGDKHMAGAYPATRRPSATARDVAPAPSRTQER
jgi:hypothetical protein